MPHSTAMRAKKVVEQADEASLQEHAIPGEKPHGRRLDETNTETAAALAKEAELSSALEHYERAVEKESQGSLGDSVNLYRKAFKVCHGASIV